jgi:hypothetical protein
MPKRAAAPPGAARGGGGAAEMMMEAEFVGAAADSDDDGAAAPADSEAPSAADKVVIERVGDFAEETTIPHAVTVTRSHESSAALETAAGNLTLNGVIRVAAPYRCRRGTRVCNAVVHMRANVTNGNAFAILGGKTRIFLDGVRIKNSFLPSERAAIAAGASGNLAIGEDSTVVVTKRERTSSVGSKDGFFFASDEEATLSYDITVQNRRTQEVSVLVREQLPRSQSDKLAVVVSAETEKHPLYQRADRESTDVSWLVTVKPGATVSLPFGFNVKWPKATFVEGLQ